MDLVQVSADVLLISVAVVFCFDVNLLESFCRMFFISGSQSYIMLDSEI